MAEKPMPSMTILSPRCTSVMSRQASICGEIRSTVPGSSSRRNSSARSEKTTPKPHVASTGFCSKSSTASLGCRVFHSEAKYKPPGPPPRTATRMDSPLSRTLQTSILRRCLDARARCRASPARRGPRKRIERIRRRAPRERLGASSAPRKCPWGPSPATCHRRGYDRGPRSPRTQSHPSSDRGPK